MKIRSILGMAALLCLLFTPLRLAAGDDAAGNQSAKQPQSRNIKLVNIATGKVLAVEDDAVDVPASNAILAKDNDNAARQWKLETDGDYLKLTNRKSELALDVNGESMEDGGTIIVYDDKPDADGNDNQHWTWEPIKKAKPGTDALLSASGGWLKSKSSGLVLNVGSDGGIIQSTPDDKAKSQVWRIVEVPVYYKIVNVATGKILGVADDSVDDEAQAMLTSALPASDKNATAREWKIEKIGDAVRFVNRKSGKVLDVSGWSNDEDANIIQFEPKTEDDGNANQLWTWSGDSKNAAAGRRLISSSSSLALDVDSDGNAIQRRSSPSAKSQMWRLVQVND